MATTERPTAEEMEQRVQQIAHAWGPQLVALDVNYHHRMEPVDYDNFIDHGVEKITIELHVKPLYTDPDGHAVPPPPAFNTTNPNG